MWIGILICSVTKELKFYNPLQHFHKLPDKAIYIMASDAKKMIICYLFRCKHLSHITTELQKLMS